MRLFKGGGLGCTIRMMESWRSDEPIQFHGACLLFYVMHNISEQNRAESSITVAETLVKALEFHKTSAELFVIGCNALVPIIQPGAPFTKKLLKRALRCTWNGVVAHQHDEDQDIARLVTDYFKSFQIVNNRLILCAGYHHHRPWFSDVANE